MSDDGFYDRVGETVRSPTRNGSFPVDGSRASVPPDIERIRRGFGGSESGPKESLESFDPYVQIDRQLVAQLRQLQGIVSLYINGYLVFEQVREVCAEGVTFCNDADPEMAGFASKLRANAWEKVRDAYNRRPDGFMEDMHHLDADYDYAAAFEKAYRAISDAISGDESPFNTDRPFDVPYCRQLGNNLSRAVDATAEIVGVCRRTGTRALDLLAAHVESIFSRSEDARRIAEQAMKEAVDQRPRGGAVPSPQLADAMGVGASASKGPIPELRSSPRNAPRDQPQIAPFL